MGKSWLVGSMASVVALMVCLCPVSGGIVTYVTPSEAMTSNANWSAVNGTYAQNFGYAFTTGSSGPFSIDWVNLQLNTSGQTVGAGALTIALRSTTNIMAYSAAAGTTAYAADTVNFTMPTTTSTSFTLNLTAAQLPNLSAFAMQSNTAYALILYAPSVNIGMMRKTGYADGTTNNFYQVTNGFTMLNTFRNNVKYQNNASSFPSLGISFGATTGLTSVPEPGAMFVCGLIGIGVVYRLRRRTAC